MIKELGFPLPIRLGDLGERRKLPQRAENEFGAIWSCQKGTGGSHLEHLVLVSMGGYTHSLKIFSPDFVHFKNRFCKQVGGRVPPSPLRG